MDAGLIEDFGEMISVKRQVTSQEVVNGHIQQGQYTELQVLASVQPMRGQELVMLPEADRLKSNYKVYSTQELKTINPVAKTGSDVITYQDTAFEIVAVERWVLDDYVYYKSIARRIDDK